MAILDHFIVPSHDPNDAANFLAYVLDVGYGEIGRFSAVFINDTLTADFAQSEEFDTHHSCFLVRDEEFDAILTRLQEKKIPYRSGPRGPMDMKFNTAHGGRNLYWLGPDGHNWEILTVSYARAAKGAAAN